MQWDITFLSKIKNLSLSLIDRLYMYICNWPIKMLLTIASTYQWTESRQDDWVRTAGGVSFHSPPPLFWPSQIFCFFHHPKFLLAPHAYWKGTAFSKEKAVSQANWTYYKWILNGHNLGDPDYNQAKCTLNWEGCPGVLGIFTLIWRNSWKLKLIFQNCLGEQ